MAALAAENIAEIECERGRYREAEDLLRDSLRVWRASENRFMLANCLEFLARVTSRTGRIPEALELLAEARTAFAAVGAREDALRADARVAECRVMVGDADAALTLASEALERGSADGDTGMITALLSRIRGYALAQRGEIDEARSAFERSVESARSRGEQYELALSLVALARLPDAEGHDESRDAAEEGSGILTRLGVIAVPAILLDPVRSDS